MPDREAAELVLDKEKSPTGSATGIHDPMSWTLEEARELSDGQFPIVASEGPPMTGNRGMVQINRQMDRQVRGDQGPPGTGAFRSKERDLLPYLTFQEYVRE